MAEKYINRISQIFLALWFGGFTFYAGIVVPIGGELIGETTQGFITQKSTFWMNIIGGITLGLVGWKIWKMETGRIYKRWSLLLFVSWGVQVFLHPLLSGMLDPTQMSVLEPLPFYRTHQAYLWAATVQWIALLGLFWVSDKNN